MSAQVLDAYGNTIPPTQRLYVQTALAGQQVYAENPYYNSASAAVAAAVPAPQYRPSWDNIIGTPAYRTLGHAVMPLRIIWSSPVTLLDPTNYQSAVITFAAAISAPIDQEEEGLVTGFSIGSKIVYTQDAGLTVPEGMSPFMASAMAAAIDGMIIYPGSEVQNPDPTIVSYEGVEAANAFRGLRYILVKDWPLGLYLKDLNLTWSRTNNLNPPSGRPRVPTRPPRRPNPVNRRNPPKNRAVSGDYSCFQAYTDANGNWVSIGADTFTETGDIWAGAAGIDANGNPVFVMAGDGPAP